MANVGKTIKTLRIRKGMTQEDMAEKLFVSRQTVSNYENGKSNPDIDILIKIAELLDTDVNTLIYGEKEKEDKKKRIIIWCMLFLLLVVAFVGAVYIDKKLVFFMSRYYVAWPRLLLRAWAYPVVFGFAGWLLADAVFILFDIKRKSGRKAVIIHWLAVGIAAAYFIFLLPITVRGGVETYRWYTAFISRQSYSGSVTNDGWYMNTALLLLFYLTSSKCTVFSLLSAIQRATEVRVKKDTYPDT